MKIFGIMKTAAFALACGMLVFWAPVTAKAEMPIDEQKEGHGSFETAQGITLTDDTTIVEGALESTDEFVVEQDYYQFGLSDTGWLNLAFRHTKIDLETEETGDCTVGLYNNARELLVEYTVPLGQDKDFGRIGLPATDVSSFYYIRISQTNAKLWENYTLTITRAAASDWETEKNDTKAAANAITKAVPINGTLIRTDDVDYYKYVMGAAGLFSLQFGHAAVTDDTIAGNTNYCRIEIYDDASNKVTWYDVTAKETAKTYNPISLPAGTYYIYIRSLSGVDLSHYAYQLQASDTAPTVKWELEWNNSPETAEALAVNTTITSSLMSADDIDYYRINVNTVGYINISLKHAPGSSGDAYCSLRLTGVTVTDKGNVYYEIYSTPIAGNVATNDLGPIPIPKGTYYIDIKPAASSAFSDGSYELSFTETPKDNLEAELNDSLETADDLSIGGVKSGYMIKKNDADLYRFVQDQNGYIYATCTHDTVSASNLFCDIEILDKNGLTIVKSSSLANQAQTNTEPRRLAPGTYYIRISNAVAPYTKIPYSVTINRAVAASGITISKTSLSMNIGEVANLSAEVTPKTAVNTAFTWSSSKPGVAIVNDAGRVQAVSAGTATITATATDGGFTASCTVTVNRSSVRVSGVSLDKTKASMHVGDQITLTAAVTPAQPDNPAVAWSSSSTGIITVDNTGKVKAVALGTAEVIVKTADGGFTAKCTVDVVKKEGWIPGATTSYWYENDIKQGTEGRGKEIYDPESKAWYWLDAVQGGAVAKNKDVYMDSGAGIFADNPDGTGKWVRYDRYGRMVKGWDKTDAGRYYFDKVTGAMVKGMLVLDAVDKEDNPIKMAYEFDLNTGILYNQFEVDNDFRAFGWNTINGTEFWFEEGVKLGIFGRGKEIYDPESDAWYWLDSVDGGKKAVSKDVYQESGAGDWGEIDNGDGTRSGKWVRYDREGHMIKGWSAGTGEDAVWIDSPDQADGRPVYYFDWTYGTMAKGNVVIDNVSYYFDPDTGILQN